MIEIIGYIQPVVMTHARLVLYTIGQINKRMNEVYTQWPCDEPQIYVCLASLKPEMRAESARQTKAKKAMLMDAADESVNTLSVPSRMRLVIGMAADSADIIR